MDDLISRQAAMAFPLSWEHRDKEHGSDEFISGVECYRDYIEGLPSIYSDVARDIATIIENEQDMRVMLASKPSAKQEIIRCKDCGHADWCGLPEGRLYCMVHEHYLSEDDYCSYGVKEDG